MFRNSVLASLLWLGFLCWWPASFPGRSARMPREDVVDVPAIGEGLCVSNVFQTNMVLQRDKPISIWGWADAGEKVTVSFRRQRTSGHRRRGSIVEGHLAGDGRQFRSAHADRQRREQDAHARQHSGSVTSGCWVDRATWSFRWTESRTASSKSCRPITRTSESSPFRPPTDPTTSWAFRACMNGADWFGRHFRKGDWDVCSPEIVRELSAIGYVFARRIHMATQVPIGIIDASRGGTTVETWTPDPVLRKIESEPVQNPARRMGPESLGLGSAGGSRCAASQATARRSHG